MRHAFKDQCKSFTNYRKLFAKAFSPRCFRPSGWESNRRNQDVKVDEVFFIFVSCLKSLATRRESTLKCPYFICKLFAWQAIVKCLSLFPILLRVLAGNKAVKGSQCVNVHS